MCHCTPVENHCFRDPENQQAMAVIEAIWNLILTGFVTVIIGPALRSMRTSFSRAISEPSTISSKLETISLRKSSASSFPTLWAIVQKMCVVFFLKTKKTWTLFAFYHILTQGQRGTTKKRVFPLKKESHKQGWTWPLLGDFGVSLVAWRLANKMERPPPQTIPRIIPCPQFSGFGMARGGRGNPCPRFHRLVSGPAASFCIWLTKREPIARFFCKEK